ncbi:ABC-2 type transport system permease protein [Nocardioides salarius]|uniref:ABC-2 type transport system permease protein n=1 Tax=Nocardioides salarius TaxID=374513 RepID=A0ABS2MGU3_9ACTN|nr:ABC transporter permease [Nocardioides salarius]MBM7510419.1 ABC-2 type transport system permease protein [Nocardioides salarius]
MSAVANGTFTPRPGGAPLHRQVVAQARMEARLMLRNGEQLLLAVVIPVIVLVGAVAGSARVGLDLDGRPVDVFTPGVLALAVMSTAFTSLAIATGFERRYGVIKRLGSSPLPRTGLLAGKVLALLLVELLQLVVVGGVALLLGWSPAASAAAVAGAVATAALGTAAFAALGLFVAGVLRAEATLAAANLVYLLLLAGGAVVLPATAYGGFGEVVRWLPSGALGGGMRDALIDGQVALLPLAVLAGWAALGTVLTARTFKWE